MSVNVWTQVVNEDIECIATPTGTNASQFKQIVAGGGFFDEITEPKNIKAITYHGEKLTAGAVVTDLKTTEDDPVEVDFSFKIRRFLSSQLCANTFCVRLCTRATVIASHEIMSKNRKIKTWHI
jgi:hypothetical protein